MPTDTSQLHDQIQSLADEGLSERAIAERLTCSLYRVKVALGRPTQSLERRGAAIEQAVGEYHQERAQEHLPPIIEGVTAAQATNPANIWQFAIEAQKVVFEKQERRGRQAISLPDEPVAIAFLSDLHIGSAGTDYEAVRADAQMVRDTPGMYAIFHGDGMDNFIIGKLQAIQRGQALGFDAERLLFEDWINMVAPKLIAWVEGNHDLWSEKLVGINPNRKHLDDVRMLWDRHQCVFDLHHCGFTRKVKIRHKWKYGSVFNPTHGLQVGWERGDDPYDIAVGGHTHRGTMCHAFYRHGQIRHAILTGTYKTYDDYGAELGYPRPTNKGCGALVLDVDGSQMFMDNLATAAKFLAFLRGNR